MPILGAHMSIAGGYHKAVDAAADLGMDTVQLFTKNNNQWKAKPIASEEAAEFQKSIKTHSLSHPLSHSSYLINLASADDLLWQKSIDAFVEELSRATLLGIPFVVVHPGSHTTITEAEGLERVVDALDEVHRHLADWIAGNETHGEGRARHKQAKRARSGEQPSSLDQG